MVQHRSAFGSQWRGWMVGFAALALGGCASTPWTARPAPPVISAPPPATPQEQPARPELTAFKAVLNGQRAVPPNDSLASGELVAVLNPETGLFRWKLQFVGLSGPVRRAGFHSPGMDGEIAPLVLPLGSLLQSTTKGRAQLSGWQQANLLAGQWYVNLPTEQYPTGELRGQLIEQR